jgi:hypothetical protein
MKVVTLKKMLSLVMLGILLLIAACATSEVATSWPTPYDYSDYYRPQDPQYWQMYLNSQGGG